MTYICDDCKKEIIISGKKLPNPDTGKLLCQKCSCKYTNKRISKRNKNSKTIKEKYDSGEFDHLKELYRNNRIKYNKTIQSSKIKNFSKEKKKEIKNKKRKTFYEKSIEERQKINKRRTTAFKEYNEKSHKRKLEYIQSLSEEEAMIAREYQYDFNNNWKIIVEDIRKKSKNICSYCLKKYKINVSIHHSIPFSLRPKNIELIPLCKSCHIKVENRFRKKYEETQDIYLAQKYSLELLKDNTIYYGNN